MKEAQSRQKSYADKRHKDLDFSVGDRVFIKVSSMKGVVQFRKSGKPARRYVGSFSVIEKIGMLAHRVELSSSLAGVHNVFHVSRLRKCVHDLEATIPSTGLEELVVEPNLTFVRQPIGLVARDEKRLRNKTVKLVKV